MGEATPAVAAGLTTVDAYRREIFTGLEPLEPLDLLLAEAQGALLAADVSAPGELPMFDQATVDGYAVRVADVRGASQREPVVIPVVPTGGLRGGVVQPGLAVRVVAGRPLPEGAEAVVPLEWTSSVPGSAAAPHVGILRVPAAGAYLRRAGDDVAAGALALSAGSVLGPVQIATLASLGLQRARVHPRPRVIVMASGDALLEPGEAYEHGHSYDGVSHALAAASREAGATPYRLPTVRATLDALMPLIEDHLIQADAVVIAASVQVDGYDLVTDVLGRLGEVTTREIAMDPGGVQAFGRIGPDHTPVFVVPAAPVAALVAFELFVRPAIRRLYGVATTQRPEVTVSLSRAVTSPPGRRHYVRAQVRHDPEQGYVATPIGVGLQTLTSLAAANALVVIPEETEKVPADTSLSAVLLERRSA